MQQAALLFGSDEPEDPVVPEVAAAETDAVWSFSRPLWENCRAEP